MGALVTILYNGNVVDETLAETLTADIRQIVQASIGDDDVFVYTTKASVAAGIDPVEIFVQINKHKVASPEELVDLIGGQLADWKTQNNCTVALNLNILPVEWYAKVGI